eukprot:UN31992
MFDVVIALIIVIVSGRNDVNDCTFSVGGSFYDFTPLRTLSPLTSDDMLSSLGVCGNYAKECNNDEGSLAWFEDTAQTQCSKILSRWGILKASPLSNGQKGVSLHTESGDVCLIGSNEKFGLNLNIRCDPSKDVPPPFKLAMDLPPCTFKVDLHTKYGCPTHSSWGFN